eukprot:4190312-Prymnesium_polylepis.1
MNGMIGESEKAAAVQMTKVTSTRPLITERTARQYMAISLSENLAPAEKPMKPSAIASRNSSVCRASSCTSPSTCGPTQMPATR